MEFSCSKCDEKEDHRSDVKKVLRNTIRKSQPYQDEKGGGQTKSTITMVFGMVLSKIEGILSACEHFKPQPNDIILRSSPKSGTTWLKALFFAIIVRSSFNNYANPLLTTMPHECVL